MESLFTILNGKTIHLTPSEIFDSKAYSNLIAVTFSASAPFINKYLQNFEKAEIVIGSNFDQNQQTALNVISNHLVKNIQHTSKNVTTDFYNLNHEVKNKISNSNFTIYNDSNRVIHEKFYLLQNKDGSKNRIILGSANLSNQAFSNHMPQAEDIVILDNNSLYDSFFKHYTTDLLPELISYFPKTLIKYYQESQKNQIVKQNHNSNKSLKTAFILDSSQEASVKTDAVNSILDSLENSDAELEKLNAIHVSDVLENTLKNVNQTKQESKDALKENIETVTLLKDVSIKRKGLPRKLNRKQTRKNKINKRFIERKVTQFHTKSHDNDYKGIVDRLPVIVDDEFSRSENNSGILLKTKQTNQLLPLGRNISKEELRLQLKSLDTFIENYAKYTINGNNEYAKRPFEAILYGFTAPFLQEIRNRAEGENKQDVPNFLFLGADSHTGKSTLLRTISKITAYSNRQTPILSWTDNNDFPAGRTKEKDKSDFLQYLLLNTSAATLYVDEIGFGFFEKYARDTILSTIQSATNIDNSRIIAPLIATTNANDLTFPDEVQRRIKFLNIINRFPKANVPGEDKLYNPMADTQMQKSYYQLNNSLFLDFITKMSEKLSDENTNWDLKQGGHFDFLHVTRKIFKDYYDSVGFPIPRYFPDEPITGEYQRTGKYLWRDLYLANKNSFVETEPGILMVDINKIVTSASTFEKKNNVVRYRNALPVIYCHHGSEGKSGNIIVLDKKAFLKWINFKPQKEGLVKRLKYALTGNLN